MSETIHTAKENPKMHGGWNDSVHMWIDSCEPRMKIDTIQPSVDSIRCKSESFGETIQNEMSRFKCESIQEVVNGFIWSQRLGWIDSVYYESIQ